MPPREVELVSESTGLPRGGGGGGGKVQSDLNGPTDWILRFIKNIVFFYNLGDKLIVS